MTSPQQQIEVVEFGLNNQIHLNHTGPSPTFRCFSWRSASVTSAAAVFEAWLEAIASDNGRRFSDKIPSASQRPILPASVQQLTTN